MSDFPASRAALHPIPNSSTPSAAARTSTAPTEDQVRKALLSLDSQSSALQHGVHRFASIKLQLPEIQVLLVVITLIIRHLQLNGEEMISEFPGRRGDILYALTTLSEYKKLAETTGWSPRDVMSIIKFLGSQQFQWDYPGPHPFDPRRAPLIHRAILTRNEFLENYQKETGTGDVSRKRKRDDANLALGHQRHSGEVFSLRQIRRYALPEMEKARTG